MHNSTRRGARLVQRRLVSLITPRIHFLIPSSPARWSLCNKPQHPRWLGGWMDAVFSSATRLVYLLLRYSAMSPDAAPIACTPQTLQLVYPMNTQNNIC
jgi:hypothetical protein